MRITMWKNITVALVFTCLGLMSAGCNTSKATLDTFAKFTSSTSPGEWISADGLVRDDYKARLFTAVVFENLEQDIARGNGEYLMSLAVLLQVPDRDQQTFGADPQARYPFLFSPDQRTAERLLASLTGGR